LWITVVETQLDLKMKHSEIKLSAQKEDSSMKQNINDKAEKVKVEVKQEGKEVLKWAITVIYIVLVIYFVFKPLTEFIVMIDYYIKFNIINFFFK
jgi:hypothetical protein